MKKLLSILLLIVCTISVVGCDKAELTKPLTPEEFTKIMEEKGLEVIDKTDDMNSDKYEQVYIAVAENKYQIDYYLLDNEDNANEVYQNSVAKLKEKHKDDSTKITSERDSNRKKEGVKSSKSSFKFTTTNYYYHLLRNKNTFLYMTSLDDYKDELKEISSELDSKK